MGDPYINTPPAPMDKGAMTAQNIAAPRASGSASHAISRGKAWPATRYA